MDGSCRPRHVKKINKYEIITRKSLDLHFQTFLTPIVDVDEKRSS